MKDLQKFKTIAERYSVLIVEDSPEVATSLKNMLRPFFKEVLHAKDAEIALTIYKEYSEQNAHPLDVILTDISLPGMNGLEMAKIIKKESPSQSIIISSGHQESDYFLQAIETGIDGFLLKPTTWDKLAHALEKSLIRQEVERLTFEKTALLEEAKEVAENRVKEQDLFIKNAIHELNTPLSVILTNADLIRIKYGGNEFLDQIDAAIKMVQTSYEDMAYTIRKERAVNEPLRLSLSFELSKRAAVFSTIAKAHGLTLKSTIAEDIFIRFAPYKLIRIIDNNLSNAIKYSRRESTITVTLKESRKGYELSFHNIGNPINNPEAIWNRFHRENETKGGYGLGLHIVREICKEEKVTVSLTSSLKEGTKFTYIFPKNDGKTKENG